MLFDFWDKYMDEVDVSWSSIPTEFNLNDRKKVVLKKGKNTVNVVDWVDLKNRLTNQIEDGYLKVEKPDIESRAVEGYKQGLWDDFSSRGVASIQMLLEEDGFKSRYVNSQAKEWLYEQGEKRESFRDSRELDSLDVAKKSLTSSRVANIVAALAVIIALFSLSHNWH